MSDHQDKMLSEKKRKDRAGQCVWYVIICLKGGKKHKQLFAYICKKKSG